MSQALKLIIAASHPLSLEELEHALAIGEHTARDSITTLCAGLITVDQRTYTVDWVHPGVWGFLNNPTVQPSQVSRSGCDEMRCVLERNQRRPFPDNSRKLPSNGL